MFKKLLLISILLLTITGCTFNNKDLFHLEVKFYNEGNFILVDHEEFKNYENDSYIIFAYNNYCTFSVPCEDVFKEFMTNYKIDFLSIHFDEFRETSLYDTVKYAPSIIIVNKGKIVAYLDADSDDDFIKYQDANEFTKWVKKYIYLNK